jgi:hypothetical protein
MTAGNKDKPDNVFGWGIVNALEAVLYHGLIISNKPEISADELNTEFSVYVISKNEIDVSSVKMVYTSQSDTVSAAMELAERIDGTNSGKYKALVAVNITEAPI